MLTSTCNHYEAIGESYSPSILCVNYNVSYFDVHYLIFAAIIEGLLVLIKSIAPYYNYLCQSFVL